MSDPDVQDFSRVDAYARSRQRVALLGASWRPLLAMTLAGAVGAGIIIAAVAVAQPRFAFREIVVPRISYTNTEVPRIVQRPVEVDHIVPHERVIEIPRIVTAPRSAEEFEASQPYRDATVRGRFAGPYGNGFKLDSGQTFVPVRVINGKAELAPDLRDDVTRLTLGDPVFCAPAGAESLFECQAWHQGKVEAISIVPAGRPT
jgi:hypothetical protein